MISSVKAEIEKEIKAEELKEILEKQKQALNSVRGDRRDLFGGTGPEKRDRRDDALGTATARFRG